MQPFSIWVQQLDYLCRRSGGPNSRASWPRQEGRTLIDWVLMAVVSNHILRLNEGIRITPNNLRAEKCLR
jgi:hypothetical protein